MAGRLQLKSVTKGFFAHNFLGRKKRNSYRPAIQDFSLEMNPGEIVALVGENGVGKTTALKVAMGMFRPDSGHAWLNGKPAHRCHRGAIGMMLSHRFLYPSLSGFENLAYTGALFCIPNLPMAIKESALTWELNSFLNRPVEEYSQGMRTRLALARATLTRPQFLFLDEPFAFLDDEKSLPLVTKVLRNLAITTLIATPQKSGVKFADRILTLLSAEIFSDLPQLDSQLRRA